MNPALKRLAGVIQHGQEIATIRVIGKDDLAVIAALNNVLGLSWQHEPW
jgi:hypothetical protein